MIQETGSSAVVAALDPAEDVEAQDDDTRATADEARRALSNVLHRVTEAL